MMNIEMLTRNTIQTGKPTVRAATIIKRDSETEVIDVNQLAQSRSSVIQYIEVADTEGRLYCVDALVSTSCWLKIIKLAEDSQSSNVELTRSNNGVLLKTVKSITPGEPLLLWFPDEMLEMFNIPYLMPANIRDAFMDLQIRNNTLYLQGQTNRYVCHICNSRFECPNHLKIHLALKCNSLDYHHLWTVLAKEFNRTTRSIRSLEPRIPDMTPYRLNLPTSFQMAPIGTSPDLVEMTNSRSPFMNNSQSSSNYPSPSSSTYVDSPSPNSSVQVLPVSKNLDQRYSAFKPYMKSQDILPPRVVNHLIVPQDQYRIQPPAVRPDLHAAHMETIVSNLGKSKQGHLCIYCGKVYSRKYGLKIHIRTHTGYKPLKCKYCLRSFGDPSNLNKHVRLHAEGETPYKCDICGKVLVRRRDLERHIKSRHENMDHMADTSPEDTGVKF